MKWECRTSVLSNGLIFYPGKGIMRMSGVDWVVRQPGIIERLFGITFARKVAKAKRKCTQFCDALNDGESAAGELT